MDLEKGDFSCLAKRTGHKTAKTLCRCPKCSTPFEKSQLLKMFKFSVAMKTTQHSLQSLYDRSTQPKFTEFLKQNGFNTIPPILSSKDHKEA